MNTQMTMQERIEQAQQETPICACGAPTAPAVRDGGVWLACTTLGHARPGLRRLMSLELLLGHTYQRIVDHPRFLAAA
jgi:hypothetical protein